MKTTTSNRKISSTTRNKGRKKYYEEQLIKHKYDTKIYIENIKPTYEQT